MIQFQIWKPYSKHPHSTNTLGLYAYLISLPLLAVLSFFPAHSSLLTLSNFSIIILPRHLFGRQKVSSEIQGLPRGPETAVTQQKTGLLKQLRDRRGNLKSALTCRVLSEVKSAFNKSFRGQPKHFARSRCLDDQKSQSFQTLKASRQSPSKELLNTAQFHRAYTSELRRLIVSHRINIAGKKCFVWNGKREQRS